MAKQYKIKRGRMSRGTYRAGPHPVSVIVGIAVLVALVFVGISVYEPVFEFVMSLGERAAPELPEEIIAEVEEPEPVIMESEPEPEPEPPALAGSLKAAYMPLDSYSDAPGFLRSLPSGINAVMVDVKNNQGQLLYRSYNEKAVAWGALADAPMDLQALAQSLKSEGYHLIARMQTFSDPICARGDRKNNAIHFGDSEMLWLDNFQDRGGKPWANPFAGSVQEYLTELALELAEMGAAMVVLDGLRFPDDMTGSAFYGRDSNPAARAAALSGFVARVEDMLEPIGVRTAVHFPATAIGHVNRGARYGGNPLELADTIVLSILPEDLAEGYLADGVFVTRPAADLGAMVSEVLAYAQSQSQNSLIPMLRGQMSGELALSREQMDAQLSAVRDEFVLFAGTGRYSS